MLSRLSVIGDNPRQLCGADPVLNGDGRFDVIDRRIAVLTPRCRADHRGVISF